MKNQLSLFVSIFLLVGQLNAQQAVLPTSWSFTTAGLPLGWTESESVFYTATGNTPPAKKFDSSGDMMTIFFASNPGNLTYYLAGNSFNGGTFLVEESVDGSNWTTLHTHTSPPAATYVLFTDVPNTLTRYIRFNYLNKVSGNIGLDDVSIAAGVTPQGAGPFDVVTTTPTICAGEPVTLSVNALAGSISGLTCASATNNGTLTAGVAVSGVNSVVPYTGGNSGIHNGQTVTSTGITGLTATLSSGSFANGAGSLSYIITGTPSTSGTASFALSIGGQTCTLTRTVTTLVSQYPTGSVFCAAGPTAIIDVTNPTTGRIWMDRNLGASQVATSSTDANAYGDLYQWGRKSDGHQCRTSTTTSTLSSSDIPGNSSFILAPNVPNDWRSPQNDNLWQGLNGLNNPCPSGYRIPNSTELNNEVNSWSAITTIDAFNSVLKFPAAGSRHASFGTLNNVGGNVTLWTSTVQSISSLGLGTGGGVINSQNRSRGQSVRCIKEIDGSIGALNCGSATVTGNLNSGATASSVSSSVPYTNGDGGFYGAQSVSSSGVTGLTASISQGLFASGAGNLVYTITGTPSASGTASFALSIGGQSCTLNTTVNSVQPAYPAGSVFCNGATIVNDVISSATSKTWMDRNLGASQVATSSSDANSFGDLYQWGRRSDGHQCRTSTTTPTLSSVDQPTHGNFITNSTNPIDWRSPQNTNLWQGINGINNPCPAGYRLPSQTELSNENILQPSTAMSSELKAPQGGYRSNTGSLTSVATWGYYWTNTISGTLSKHLKIGGGPGFYDFSRATGASVRCIKETIGSIGALNCGSSTVTGNLISGTAASGVSASVPYTGGNSGFYESQSISSAGVTGLTATITQGLFTSSTGSLVYAISGTPSASGTATFALNICGQSCNLSIIVYGAQPTYPVGSVFCNGATIVNDVTNPTTGKTWMDRNLGATRSATSSTDANSYGDLYQWGRRSDGHQCRNSTITSTLSSSDQPAHGSFITAQFNFNWRNPQNQNLWQGVNGINNPCPSGYRLPTLNEINEERASWNNTYGDGAFNTIKLIRGGRRYFSTGSLTNVGQGGYYWSSTVTTIESGSSHYLHYNTGETSETRYRANGYSVRCIKETIGSIGELNCGSSTLTGNLISGTAASGVSASVPYTNGDGGFYGAQSVSSSGVTGLTATISQGLFASGSGNLVYTITGIPSASGTASFELSIGGQSCTLNLTVNILQGAYPVGSVFCAAGPTVIVDVVNPTTGKTWMDRNLGATQKATSSSDVNSYGDLYQWGRRSDGHQCRNSATTSTLSSTDQPSHGSFIVTNGDPNDWRSPQNNTRWQGVNGVNNPCPSGYRIPTVAEFDAERLSWSSNNAAGAIASPLKLPMAGRRVFNTGSIDPGSPSGFYWTSGVSLPYCQDLVFSATSALPASNLQWISFGDAVRCIKN